MPAVLSLQKVQSIGQIFFPQPAILHGIIPSPSLLKYSPNLSLPMGYNLFNLILLVVGCNNRIVGPLPGSTR